MFPKPFHGAVDLYEAAELAGTWRVAEAMEELANAELSVLGTFSA